MMLILLSKPEFEYDIHSLVKAFYPDEEMEMYYTCDPKEVQEQNVACTHHEVGAELDEKRKSAAATLEVHYQNDVTAFCFSIRTGSTDEAKVYNAQAKCDEDRTIHKNHIKQALYKLLEEATGQTLPWGTLTGIRPTKLPMKMLEEGMSEEAIRAHLKDTYFATDKKVDLSIEIAKRESELLKQIDYERGYSLYIGIPFCPSTCLYCSFTSYPLKVWAKEIDRYLDALEKEIDFVAERMKDRPLNSIYFGGGTPTTLEAHQLHRLISKVKSSFDLSHCVEFTVEAGRPDSITIEKLQTLHELGIDRISVNPQTMKQETLDLIGRHHTVEETIESFHMAREAGIGNINMDLIIGLPGETLEDVRNTMEQVTALRPDNITVHSLAVKRAARLTIYKDFYKDMQMVNTAEHMDLCEEYCRSIGLNPYYLYRQKGMAGNMENVGYAAEGKAGVYNILIMEEKQTIMALGAGATTKFVLPELNPNGTNRIERVENVKDVKNYLERIDEMIERKKKYLGE